MMIRYLEGSCSADEENTFREWLYQSEENRALFYQTKAVWNYRHVAHFNTDEQLNSAVARLNGKLKLIGQKRRKKVYLSFAKYAAVLFFTLLTAMLMWTSYHHFYGETDLITVQVARTDSSKLVVLNDGSRVWLNSNSRITYPVKFSGAERKVTFSGEAYFEIKHDTLHPFKVKTAGVQVKVLGTSFNLRAYASERKTETVLVEGKVLLQNENDDDLTVLAPGQMAQYDNTSKHLLVKGVNAQQYALWRYGMLTFTHASLNEITQNLAGLYQVHFVMDDSIDRAAVYNFNFRKGQPIDKVMQMLCFIALLSYEKKGNEILIRRK